MVKQSIFNIMTMFFPIFMVQPAIFLHFIPMCPHCSSCFPIIFAFFHHFLPMFGGFPRGFPRCSCWNQDGFQRPGRLGGPFLGGLRAGLEVPPDLSAGHGLVVVEQRDGRGARGLHGALPMVGWGWPPRRTIGKWWSNPEEWGFYGIYTWFMIAKLVYKSNNYGLWYANNYSIHGVYKPTNITGGPTL